MNISKYDGIILAVAHYEFKTLNLTAENNTVVYDIKSIFKDAD